MKIKAGDLKHGQRFLRGELNCTAAGMVSACGQCLHLMEGELGWIDKDREVELIEPTYRPYDETEMLELLGKKVLRKNKLTKHGWLITIVDDGSTVVGHLPVNAWQLLRYYTFLDGEACGVLE